MKDLDFLARGLLVKRRLTHQDKSNKLLSKSLMAKMWRSLPQTRDWGFLARGWWQKGDDRLSWSQNFTSRTSGNDKKVRIRCLYQPNAMVPLGLSKIKYQLNVYFVINYFILKTFSDNGSSPFCQFALAKKTKRVSQTTDRHLFTIKLLPRNPCLPFWTTNRHLFAIWS